jgi:hypothetical protein
VLGFNYTVGFSWNLEVLDTQHSPNTDDDILNRTPPTQIKESKCPMEVCSHVSKVLSSYIPKTKGRDTSFVKGVIQKLTFLPKVEVQFAEFLYLHYLIFY